MMRCWFGLMLVWCWVAQVAAADDPALIGQPRLVTTPAAVSVQPRLGNSFSAWVPEAVLPASPAEAGTALREANAQRGNKARQIGFARDLPATEQARLAQWQWTAVAGGQAARLAVQSLGARGLRLEAVFAQVPPGLEVRVRGNAEAEWAEWRVGGVGAQWSPVVFGDRILLEFFLPAGQNPADLRVTFPRLSHLLTGAADLAGNSFAAIGDADTCNLDATCNSTLTAAASAVAKMIFTELGSTYDCTGTVLADRGGSTTPYFYSANHCISTQTVASTLQTLWFYDSSVCNGLTLSSKYQRLTGGADLLYASTPLDVSFMRLRNVLPAGVTMAGWNANALTSNTTVTGVHHPAGDLKKYSQGRVNRTSVSFSSSLGPLTEVIWSTGITEEGSSGSGLFTVDNGQYFLRGGLYGGGSSCRSRTSPDVYSRLDLAYANLSNYLNAAPATTAPAGSSSVYRFYNTIANLHFYTVSETERDNIIATLSNMRYEGVGYYVYNQSSGGPVPVYRFLNKNNVTHFLTADSATYQTLLADPKWGYEGIAFYAYAAGTVGSPVRRFYDSAQDKYFYSISDDEYANITANLPNWVYQGVAFNGVKPAWVK